MAKLLDDDDLSRFGSDVEDLEEDFVVKANLLEGEDRINEEDEEEEEEGGVEKVAAKEEDSRWAEQENEFAQGNGEDTLKGGEKPRVRRLLDEQFDLVSFCVFFTISFYTILACPVIRICLEKCRE